MPDDARDARVGAFFDLDHTVLSESSSILWVRYLRRQGRVNGRQMLRFAWWALRYRLALIDMVAITRGLVADMKGQSEAELAAECDRWFDEMVAPCIAQRARECVGEHLARGHVVALLTASSPYVAGPVARSLGLGDRFICTRLEVVDGVFTGRCVEPVCYGPGKLHWARAFAAEHRVDLARSYFYTDSYTDLPMLEAVGHPVVVNPDPRLRRRARNMGWPEVEFF